MFGTHKTGPTHLPLPGHRSRSPSNGIVRLLGRHSNKTTLTIFATCSVIALGFFIFSLPRQSSSDLRSDDDRPPLYSWYHEQEQLLPQHNLDLPYPEGRRGKYIWIANHVDHSGFGNYLEDLVMVAHLAHASGRGFVFNNYTWDRYGPDYSNFNGKLIPSRIPMTAILSGPIVGGNFVDGDSTPRAISSEYFEKVCPERAFVEGDAMHKLIDHDNPTAREILDKWVDYLNKLPDRCVEINRYGGRMFDIYMFGDRPRMMDAWPTLSKSPVVTQFGWSPLVQNAFDVNRHLFAPVPATEQYTSPAPFLRASDPYAPLPGLLAIHIRRGDFEGHCVGLAHWSSDFLAFNTFSEFPDQFEKPSGKSEDETVATYLRACYPTIEQIVARVEQIRQTHSGRGLQNIYIMTNGERKWLLDLKEAFRKVGTWNQIATSRDLVLDAEQKYVAQAVDMLIGQRAQVFVGNGFSSLTSHVSIMRVSRQFPPDSTRFWM